ncbi:lipoprotein-releasing ABC transporter ATP-binding protein LolD [Candidatus Berkiella aquae]|uniref:Lipoprotein-releasing system ATP-binding protein LolD n=1 Tax=Candidatus Berkiella aquae TaxID=295108 RepID=A0A0Q9Z192_9GAMM|nr:lipoprotein-releasing ABC transporter ATP-binding protein LolD [Candidatus Berkiella aquae]MCS5711801.1 lipoprotein-releasing ABC transporter ATP-binding protein LolD [Candidatus Berkiella aquae]
MTLKTDPILYCENLKKHYQDGDKIVPVLNDVSFAIKRGESVAIVGRSGSGKTTLLNMLGGLESPSEGKVVLDNTHLHALSDRKRGYLRNRVLGLIFQFHHLLPEFTALENVCMPLLIQGLSASTAKKRSQILLEKVGLGHRETHKPAALSGGERQRVAIARALVTQPKCILADEPTGNLDNQSADQVYDLMMQLTQEFNTSFVVVTHDLSLAKRMDRIVTIERGNLREGQ